MLIGSNNSLTYLESSSWWVKVFSSIFKCQDKDYKYQYLYCGVRYFDIKIDINKSNRILIKGVNETCNYFSLYEVFDFLNKYGDATVCITLDESLSEYINDVNRRIENKFGEYCRKIEFMYDKINFCGGRRKFDNKEIHTFKGETPHVIYMNKCSTFYRVMTKIFPFMRKKLNKKYINEFKNEKGFLVLNYVENK